MRVRRNETDELKTKFEGARERERIALLLDGMLPGLEGIDATLPPDRQMTAAVEANVHWSIRQLLKTPETKVRQAEGVMKPALARRRPTVPETNRSRPRH